MYIYIYVSTSTSYSISTHQYTLGVAVVASLTSYGETGIRMSAGAEHRTLIPALLVLVLVLVLAVPISIHTWRSGGGVFNSRRDRDTDLCRSGERSINVLLLYAY